MEQKSQMLNPHTLESLEKWIKESNITLKQINGQRRYGGPPPGWKGLAPGPGCEVFISHIPRDVYEDRLIPLFQSVAPLYEFRLMMNFSGQNRGFAYAKYADTASATAAIRTLNMYPLQHGVKLAVRRSTEKRQLCLGDLPPTMGVNQLLMVLRKIADGVEGVTMNTTGPKEQDCTAVVHYSSHYAASMAKKVLVQAFRKLYGVSITIRWMCESGKATHWERDEPRRLAPPPLKDVGMKSGMPPSFRFSRDPKHPLPLPTSPSHLQLRSFSQAVQPPSSQMMNMLLPLKTRSKVEEPLVDAVRQMRWWCELHGFGVPHYDARYNYTGPDGLLYFAYKVSVPGLDVPFSGIAHILPGTCPVNMEAEVQQAAAKHLLGVIRQARHL